MDINLPAYRISRVSDLYYFFTTDSGIEYKCYFTAYGEYFSDYPDLAPFIYAFVLVSVNRNLKGLGADRRIAATVIEIVAQFLADKVNTVVYVCDPSDGRGAARARKFKSWFEYYEHKDSTIIQVNTDFDAGGIRLYTGLLVHKKNKRKKEFIQAYIEITDVDDKDPAS